MFKVKNRLLPENLQRLFVFKSGDDGRRRKSHFQTQFSHTTLKKGFFSEWSQTVYEFLDKYF